jgi:hypothetical protein
MVGTLMVLNPVGKRKGPRRMARVRRKMSALQRKYFGGGRKKARRTGGRRRSKVLIQTANPVRKRRRRLSSSRVRSRSRRFFSRNPVRRRSRRLASRSGRRFFRRNPIGGMDIRRMAVDVVLPGIAGAALSDWLYGQVSGSAMLPGVFQTTFGDAAVRLGIPILLGIAGSKVLGPSAGAAIATGGLIIEGYALLQQNVLNGGGWGGSGWGGSSLSAAGFYAPGMGRYLGRFRAPMRRVNGMGFLKGAGQLRMRGGQPANFRLSGRRRGMGYVGPARTVKGLGRYLGRGAHRV